MSIQIGLTGGMGCGKSTALSYFQKHGARVVDTDALVKRLLSEDLELRTAIAEAFGKGILDAEGKIDRAKLGRTVFSDSRALQVLETLVHPRVREEWMAYLREAHPLLVIELPLLFENGLEEYFTHTVCVSCCPELQKQRLAARGVTQTQQEQRIGRQLPIEEKIKRSTFTLHNNGSLEHFEAQIIWILKELQRSDLTPNRKAGT